MGNLNFRPLGVNSAMHEPRVSGLTTCRSAASGARVIYQFTTTVVRRSSVCSGLLCRAPHLVSGDHDGLRSGGSLRVSLLRSIRNVTTDWPRLPLRIEPVISITRVRSLLSSTITSKPEKEFRRPFILTRKIPGRTSVTRSAVWLQRFTRVRSATVKDATRMENDGVCPPNSPEISQSSNQSACCLPSS